MQFRIQTLLILCATLAIALTISLPLSLVERGALGGGVLGLWLAAACLQGGMRQRMSTWPSWCLALLGIGLATLSFSVVVYYFGLTLREYVEMVRSAGDSG